MLRSATHKSIQAIAWLLLLICSGLVIAESLPYLALGDDFAFLVEKGDVARIPVWRAAFLLHVSGALLSLVLGPWLCSRWALRRSRRLHRWLGRSYYWAVLGQAVPGGLILAPWAKGGTAGVMGFLLLGLLWLGTTGLGLVEIRRRRIGRHARWMLRSYALAVSALVFRLLQLGFFLGVGLDDHTNYILSLWLSLLLSLAGGELAARRIPVGRPEAEVCNETRRVVPDRGREPDAVPRTGALRAAPRIASRA